jgi:hypothetical protein
MITDCLKIILLLIVLVLFYKSLKKDSIEDFLNYKRCNTRKLEERLKVIFKEQGVNKDNNNWDLYLPCGYTNVEKELRKLNYLKQNQKIFAIDGCDKIVSKYYLWINLKKKYGDNYTDYMPRTYANNLKDIKKLLKNHKEGNKYIAKKDVQAQTGLHLIHDINDLKPVMYDKKYLVIQELLNNPFLIDSRKINIRVYFLIVCTKGKINAYIHSNGFVYYTPKYFNYESKDKDTHITTGYIDRSIYAVNPLTLKDFYRFLDKSGYSSTSFFNNVKNLFKSLMKALNIPVCNKSNFKNNTSFQLFGADVAPDNNLNVKLIEINKGPDLNAKDKRDNQVKDKVVRDVFDITGVIKSNTHNEFSKVW